MTARALDTVPSVRLPSQSDGMNGDHDLLPISAARRVTTVRVFLSSLAAVAAPGMLLMLVFLPPTSSWSWDLSDWLGSLVIMMIATEVAGFHFVVFGIPYVLLLLKTGYLRWLPMVLGGFAIGSLPLSLFTTTLPNLHEYSISGVGDLMAMAMDYLAIAVLPGLFGALSGVAFMLTFRGLSAADARAARRHRRDKAKAATGHAVAVYFNSACPVCRTGVEWQQGRASSCEIEWIDVHNAPEAIADVGAQLEDVRERLHVRDAEGQILVGADAVAFVMRTRPRQRWLGRLLTLPLVRPVMRWAYDAFARVLYRWNRRKGRW